MQTSSPNILLIMVDQLAGPALPVYGHPVVKTPHLSALAEEGIVFDQCHCNSPLCAPSRASMLSGQLPSHLGTFDNAAEFPAEIPTMAHYLRALGYQTCLVGKMHLIGPDQLHGFEERLTTDIYPADFGWTPDWTQPPEHRFSWYHNMLSVVQAGQCVTSNQFDFDEEVAFRAVRKIFNMARNPDERPFFMTVSFTHPHDPFATTQRYWDLYEHDDIDMPAINPLPYDQLDPHSQRLYQMCEMGQYRLTADRVRNARHAYYSAISYIDEKIGQILQALKSAGLDENTVIIFTSDHGEMLGERGMWYKMNFFEWSARVPLIMHAPERFSARRVRRNVSLVDLLPTLVDLAATGETSRLSTPVDGASLIPLMQGDDSTWDDTVYSEYLAEGAVAPCLMVLRGRYKYIYSEVDPPQLYNLETDPQELTNLAGQPDFAAIEQSLSAAMLTRWNPSDLKENILQSQQRRRLVFQALMSGQYTAWDFQSYEDASKQYMRNHLDLNELERRARYPSPEIPWPDVLE
jgi:choline-sulfatase